MTSASNSILNGEVPTQPTLGVGEIAGAIVVIALVLVIATIVRAVLSERRETGRLLSLVRSYREGIALQTRTLNSVLESLSDALDDDAGSLDESEYTPEELRAVVTAVSEISLERGVDLSTRLVDVTESLEKLTTARDDIADSFKSLLASGSGDRLSRLALELDSTRVLALREETMSLGLVETGETVESLQ